MGRLDSGQTAITYHILPSSQVISLARALYVYTCISVHNLLDWDYILLIILAKYFTTFLHDSLELAWDEARLYNVSRLFH